MKRSKLVILFVIGGAVAAGCSKYKPVPTSVMCWPMVPQIDNRGNYVPLFQMNLADTPNANTYEIDGTLATGQDIKVLTPNGLCVTITGPILQSSPTPVEPMLPKVTAPVDGGPK